MFLLFFASPILTVVHLYLVLYKHIPLPCSPHRLSCALAHLCSRLEVKSPKQLSRDG